MVEYTSELDIVFHSLSDPIRRDMLELVAVREYSVGELVAHFDVSFAAISKHLMVLEDACLIRKRKEGRKRMISLYPGALASAEQFLGRFAPDHGHTHSVGVY